MGKKQFVGTWKLVSSEFRRSDGQVIYPMGKDATGRAMFDASGYMSAHIMRPGRLAFAIGDNHKGTPAEIKTAFEGYVAYYGTYKVDEQERTITTQVEGSLFPNWIGTGQKRFYEFSGNRMTLSSPLMHIGGEQVTAQMIWEYADDVTLTHALEGRQEL